MFGIEGIIAVEKAAHEARKTADNSKFIDGRPNPNYPRLNVEADILELKVQHNRFSCFVERTEEGELQRET